MSKAQFILGLAPDRSELSSLVARRSPHVARIVARRSSLVALLVVFAAAVVVVPVPVLVVVFVVVVVVVVVVFVVSVVVFVVVFVVVLLVLGGIFCWEKRCSTSLPGGNQVDGLPPALSNTRAIIASWAPERKRTRTEFEVTKMKIAQNLTILFEFW